MVQIKRITILTLWLLSHNLVAQSSSLDSISFYTDSSLLDFKVDKLNNSWYFYPNFIVRTSLDKAYNDTVFIPYQKEKIQIDLAFSFKNLVYNRQRNYIELLNSRWGVLSKIQLDKINIFQPSLVNFSADENYWILDKESNQLLKINESGVIKYQIKNPFFQENKYYFPTELTEYGSFSIAIDTHFGLFILSNYGQLIQAIPIDSFTSFFAIHDRYYIQSNKFLAEYSYDFKVNKLMSTGRNTILKSKIISIATQNKNAVIFTENNRIYQVKNIEMLFKRF
jgi:hypothetical protein